MSNRLTLHTENILPQQKLIRDRNDISLSRTWFAGPHPSVPVRWPTRAGSGPRKAGVRHLSRARPGRRTNTLRFTANPRLCQPSSLTARSQSGMKCRNHGLPPRTTGTIGMTSLSLTIRRLPTYRVLRKGTLGLRKTTNAGKFFTINSNADNGEHC